MNPIDKKIADLLRLTDEFLFPAYYPHTGKDMWKIANAYTDYSSETLVLCGVDEGIEAALDIAIDEIGKRRKAYYAKPNPERL
jgi:hypothetical protein